MKLLFATIAIGLVPLETCAVGNYRARAPIEFSQAQIADQKLPPLTPEEYKGLKWTADELIKKFPPNEYLYVGIGRSPSPVLALVELLKPGVSLEIPISDLSFFEDFGSAKKERLVEHHFRQFLPHNPGKNILVIDYVFDGGTLTTATKVIERIYEGSRTKVEALGLVGQVSGLGKGASRYKELEKRFFKVVDSYGATYPEPRDLTLDKKKVSLLKVPKVLAGRFQYKRFAAYARYNSLPIDSLSKNKPMLNPAYAEFMQVLRKFAGKVGRTQTADCRDLYGDLEK